MTLRMLLNLWMPKIIIDKNKANQRFVVKIKFEYAPKALE